MQHVFLMTAQRGDEYVAVFGDQDVLGETGIADLRNAIRANARAVMRRGVITVSKEHLDRRISELEELLAQEGGH
ncbi:MAG: hypothetical protein KGL10_01395 [Alphaproteobacteria bacterium]|nr:hypothetical protein [Alphaproteobacteria bacterium]MDE2335942.1 hypothetical protein [Alphaproteobacteria bacterium]